MIDGIEIVHVVAMDNQRCIGTKNALPWHLPADLQHFKRITSGGVIVMGRKTYDSIGRSLPARHNLVLTRNPAWFAEGVYTAMTLDDVLQKAILEAKKREQTAIFIIGGAKLFTSTLDMADHLEVTHIDTTVQGDAFYPVIPDYFHKVVSEKQVDEATGLGFEFVTYRLEPVR